MLGRAGAVITMASPFGRESWPHGSAFSTRQYSRSRARDAASGGRTGDRNTDQGLRQRSLSSDSAGDRHHNISREGMERKISSYISDSSNSREGGPTRGRMKCRTTTAAYEHTAATAGRKGTEASAGSLPRTATARKDIHRSASRAHEQRSRLSQNNYQR